MYIDSGSGSMLVSAIVAGAAGAGVVAKMQWRRLTGATRRANKAAAAEAPETTAPPAMASDKTEQQ